MEQAFRSKRISAFTFLLMQMVMHAAVAQCDAVTWSYQFNGNGTDVIHRAARHPGGDLYVAGHTTSFGTGQDLFIARFTNDTALVWAKTYGLSGNDGGESMDIHFGASGDLYVSGAMQFGTQQDAGLMKLDEDGNAQWAVRILPMFGLAHGRAILELPGGDVLVGGSTNSIGGGNVDAFVARFDPLGSLIWLKSYGGSGQDHITDMHRLADGTIVLNSQTSSFSSTRKAYVARINADGTLVAANQYGGTIYDDLITSYKNADGTFLRIGFTDSFGPGDRDVLAMLTDSVGGVIWSRSYGTSSGDEWGLAAVTRPGGGWYVTAFDVLSRQLFLLHLRPDGSLLRTYQMDDLHIHANASWGQAIYPSNDGNFLITASAGANMDDAVLVKLDACGENFCGMTQITWIESLFSIPVEAITIPISATSSNVEPITPTVAAVTGSFSNASDLQPCIGSSIMESHVSPSHLELQPNPVIQGEFFHIDLSRIEARLVVLSIHDVAGRLVRSDLAEGTSGTFRSPRTSGIYSVHLHSEGRLIATGKLIVQ